ncbi:hypothetical protein BG004_006747 [Podila humilis]|nr:hypothetical protein BG004_006747 [Podila humilis]
MDESFSHDGTPHPRLGDHSSAVSHSGSRPQSRQESEKTTRALGYKPSIFNSLSHRNDDDDSELDSESGTDDNTNHNLSGIRHRRRRTRRRRLSASASHLLAQAPTVPDLRFDHNYRKALDQVYVAHAADLAKAEAAAAATSPPSPLSSSTQPQQPTTKTQQQQHVSVPSIKTRIAVMTLRDIIIMPFVHGFFWGFGTILLTMASQRSLAYHLTRSFNRLFGREDGNGGTTPMFRGEPARIRRATSGPGSVGLSGGRPGFAY